MTILTPQPKSSMFDIRWNRSSRMVQKRLWTGIGFHSTSTISITEVRANRNICAIATRHDFEQSRWVMHSIGKPCQIPFVLWSPWKRIFKSVSCRANLLQQSQQHTFLFSSQKSVSIRSFFFQSPRGTKDLPSLLRNLNILTIDMWNYPKHCFILPILLVTWNWKTTNAAGAAAITAADSAASTAMDDEALLHDNLQPNVGSSVDQNPYRVRRRANVDYYYTMRGHDQHHDYEDHFPSSLQVRTTSGIFYSFCFFGSWY